MILKHESLLPIGFNRVLVTGGAGYIGSHTVLELLRCGAEICVIDNFSNASPEAIKRVKTLADREFSVEVVDLRDAEALTSAIGAFRPDAVIHFAGLKAVGESVGSPLLLRDGIWGGAIPSFSRNTPNFTRKSLWSNQVYG